MKKIVLLFVLIAGTMVSVPSVYAIDYRMLEMTWTFDEITEITSASEVQNLGGIYFQGNSDCDIVNLGGAINGSFSDGSSWKATNAFMMHGHSFDPTYLDGERRWAGVYNTNAIKNLAFNTTVSGTCYVAIRTKTAVQEGANFSLHCQYKGLHSSWTHKTFVTTASDEVTELKLYCEAAGSFWISSSQDAFIYAVRFVPDDIMTLEKTRIQPQNIKQLSNGNWFVDFGKDAFGQIELTLSSDNDSEIIIHLGECLEDGQINRNPGGSRRYRTITLPIIAGTHTYHPEIPADERNTRDRAIHMPMEIGEVMPFRYCEIEGYNNVIVNENIAQLAVHHAFNDAASYFRCDNDALNQVWELCKYSMKATSFSGYYVDGDRERIPYEADMLINQLGYYANDCEFSLGRRTVDRLLRIPNGYCEWIMQTILCAYYDYWYSGDKKLITKFVEELRAHTMQSFVHPVTGLVSSTAVEQTEQLLASINRTKKIEDIVDWPHVGTVSTGGEDDHFEYTDYNTVVNAYHYEVVKKMAEIYKALNMTEEQQELENYCSDFKTLFNNSFLDTEKGIYRDGLTATHSSLHANMFALCFGLVPDEYVESVADFIAGRGMVCSVYGSQFLLDALYKCGRDTEALQLMINDTDRGWLNMIKKGSTISMEAWDDVYKTNQDWNHAWGAAPANIIPFQLMGIRSLLPGFSRAEIRPQIGSLTQAECKIPTVNGPISVKLNKNETEFVMDVDISNTIEGVLYIPLISKPQYSTFVLTIDGDETNDYSIDDGYVRLTNTLSGKHIIKLSYAPYQNITLAANEHEGNFWTTFYYGTASYKISDEQNACAYTAQYSIDGDNTTLTLYKLGKDIPAQTAVVIVSENTPVSLSQSDNILAYSGTTNHLHGIDYRTAVSTVLASITDASALYMLGKTSTGFGFHLYSGENVPPHKAFLALDASKAAKARSFTMTIDNTTDININMIESKKDSYWYSLDGRMYNAKPIKKGVYVKEGKKIVVL